MTWLEALADPKAWHEANIIVGAFAARDIHIVGVATEGGGVAYMYARDRILARQQYLGGQGGVRGPQRVEDAHRQRGVLDVLREHDAGAVEVIQVARGIVAINLNPDRPEPEERDAGFFLGRIEEEFGTGLATPDHVVTAAQGHPSGCPATEPQEVYDSKPYPPACPGTAGHGVRIYVADTGIVRDTVTSCPWLDGVTGDDDPSVGTDGTIQPYGGHGTFVAGVIRCLAPGAEIVVRNVFDTAGSALESDFVPKLYQGFGYGAEIFHITVSSPTRCNLPLMAFEAWLEDLRQYKGLACVVPAGNNESRLPHWPAAFPELISVGALGPDWRSRAYFSDYGGWVDVYAPGQNLINAFPTGTFTCEIPPFAGETRTFSGLAQWSGTSFSTPIVTGLIAARMTRCGESAREAAAALLARARAEAVPGVGPVLLPGCDDDAEPCERCGGERRHRGCGCDAGCGCGCGDGRGHGGRPGRMAPTRRLQSICRPLHTRQRALRRVVGAGSGVGSYDGGVTEVVGEGPPGRRSYPKGVRRRQQILQSAIALFAQRGVDRASLRTVGEAIGVSHAALRHYFSSRDELLVEVYRTHEALAVGGASAADRSAVGVMAEAAERNRAIPGLVELYATLTTDALQERHAVTREFVRSRFRLLRETLAARIESGQQAGRIAADIDPLDAAALVIAASDGLQIQWLLDPGAVDVGRSLSILERLLPRDPGPDGTS